MSKLLKGKITISRPSYSSGKEVVTLELEDSLSGVRFVEVELSYENFTRVLTGQGFVDCDFEVSCLDVVGKRKETKDLIFPMEDTFKAKDIATKVCQAFTDDGWTASTYFGGQSSFRKGEDGRMYAHGTQYRFVDAQEEGI